MAGKQRADALEVVYGAIVGGLIAAFVGIAIVTIFTNNLSDASSGTQVASAIAGLVSAIVLMVGGMLVADRISWLGTSLLFASGFTAAWSALLSFSIEKRWMTLLLLGGAILVGGFMGWWRFGRERAKAPLAPPAPQEAAVVEQPVVVAGDDGE